jgi:NB-ARC domain-containing protein
VKGFAVSPAEAMARIIRAFHPAVSQLPSDEDELAGYYRGVLAGRRALIVLDNAGTEDQLRPLLTAAPPVAFLVTSRYAQSLDCVATVQVNELALDEAYSLLRGIVTGRGTKDELATITDLCGYLPLGIRVAGDFLRLKEDWPVGQYIEALRRERLRWLKVGEDPAKDVEAVLKLSSAQLARDSLDRATRWHLLHIFQGDFTAAAAAAAWDAAEDDLGVLEDLSDMKRRSLILFDADRGRYRLHDLMRPIAEGLFG